MSVRPAGHPERIISAAQSFGANLGAAIVSAVKSVGGGPGSAAVPAPLSSTARLADSVATPSRLAGLVSRATAMWRATTPPHQLPSWNNVMRPDSDWGRHINAIIHSMATVAYLDSMDPSGVSSIRFRAGTFTPELVSPSPTQVEIALQKGREAIITAGEMRTWLASPEGTTALRRHDGESAEPLLPSGIDASTGAPSAAEASPAAAAAAEPAPSSGVGASSRTPSAVEAPPAAAAAASGSARSSGFGAPSRAPSAVEAPPAAAAAAGSAHSSGFGASSWAPPAAEAPPAAAAFAAGSALVGSRGASGPVSATPGAAAAAAVADAPFSPVERLRRHINPSWPITEWLGRVSAATVAAAQRRAEAAWDARVTEYFERNYGGRVSGEVPIFLQEQAFQAGLDAVFLTGSGAAARAEPSVASPPGGRGLAAPSAAASAHSGRIGDGDRPRPAAPQAMAGAPAASPAKAAAPSGASRPIWPRTLLEGCRPEAIRAAEGLANAAYDAYIAGEVEMSSAVLANAYTAGLAKLMDFSAR